MGGALLFKISPGHSAINTNMRGTCVKYQVTGMTLGGGSKDGVEAGLSHDEWVLVYINKVSHSK